MSGTISRQPQEPEITWTMPLSLARTILSIVAKQPYETVNGIIRMLEDQGNAQLSQLEQQQRGNGAMPDDPRRTLPS
jgi:hypothetical protein